MPRKYCHPDRKGTIFLVVFFYVLLVAATLGDGNFLILTTWYFGICIPLLVIHLLGNFHLLDDRQLVVVRWFFFRKKIQISNILQIAKQDHHAQGDPLQTPVPMYCLTYLQDQKNKKMVLSTAFYSLTEIGELLQEIYKINPNITLDQHTEELIANPRAVEQQYDQKWGWASWKKAMFPQKTKRAEIKIPQEYEYQVANYERLNLLESHRGKVILVFSAIVVVTCLYMLANGTFMERDGMEIGFLTINAPLLFVYFRKKWAYYLLALAAFVDGPVLLGVFAGIFNLDLGAGVYSGIAITAGIALMTLLHKAARIEELRGG